MKTIAFLTNVGLITSNGPYGNNVMACEWTHQISYDPFLIIVCIRKSKATYDNIKKSKEFGVNITAFDQNVVSSIAGNNTGKEVDKVRVLKEFGVEFYKAKKINTLMVSGTVMNAECKLIKFIDIGDHPILIGEVIKYSERAKEPIIYHQGKYFRLGARIHKPDQKTLAKIDNLLESFKKTS